jgi:hypothetical protein
MQICGCCSRGWMPAMRRTSGAASSFSAETRRIGISRPSAVFPSDDLWRIRMSPAG